ncbi:MAG: hypothetical protein DMG13_15455 [Acidobacteria bacterium]|nr:MAG: hypothetical protein DMG13_15455 [Acidobacteriota bacterium]
MKRARPQQSGQGSLDLIEEATHLLRAAPAATLATYYVGAIPFVLGFLYFGAEMSRSPFAGQHLAEAALAMALLFIWMKFWQALFASRIRAQLTAEPPPRWSFRQSIRVVLLQAIIQPSGLFIIPLASIFVLPFAWAYAFYQNVTALAGADSSETSRLVKRAWKQASLWTWQNHIVQGVGLVFGLCVFLNWAVVSFWVPVMLKTLFGIETIFSKSPTAMLNTTSLAAIFGLTYLCVDPILKTIYALRCFHGESLQSGEDLKAGLKRFAVSPQHLAAALVILLSLACGSAATAGQSTPAVATAQDPQSSSGVSPSELNRQISEVIQGRKYAWRMPRQTIVGEDSEKGVITRFLEKLGDLVRDAVRTILDWIDTLIQKAFKSEATNQEWFGFDWRSSLLLFVLLAAVLSALAVFLLRVWRGRKGAAVKAAPGAIHGATDVADENVSADQLPEDGWTKLARSLLEDGEFRLALRAFYLASLAHLAGRNLIGIAHFKSNRDYENELRRRGHAIPDLLPMFGENLSTFERVWYGMHEADRDLVQQFSATVDKIKTAA